MQERDSIRSPEEQERLRKAFYEMVERIFSAVELDPPVRGPEDTGEGPTPQREAVAGEMSEDFITDSGRKTRRMLDGGGQVLEMLNARGSITGDQYVAGWTFYEDWYKAGLAASGVIDPGREVVDGGTHKPVSDIQLDALWNWKRAVQAVGKVHSHVLIAMVICDEKAVDYGRRMHKKTQPKDASNSAVTSLRNALQELDYHYHGRRKQPRTQSSHAPDYRPTVMSPPSGDVES